MDQHEHLAAGRNESGSTHLERLVEAIRNVRTVHDQHHGRTIGGPGRGGTTGVTNDPATLEYALATAPPDLRPSIEEMVRRHLPEKPPWPVTVALTRVEEELAASLRSSEAAPDDPRPPARNQSHKESAEHRRDAPDHTDSELAILHVLQPNDHKHGMPASAITASLKERGHELHADTVKRLLRAPFLTAHTKKDRRGSRAPATPQVTLWLSCIRSR